MTAENSPIIETIPVNEQLELRAVDERYVSELHQLVLKKRWINCGGVE